MHQYETPPRTTATSFGKTYEGQADARQGPRKATDAHDPLWSTNNQQKVETHLRRSCNQPRCCTQAERPWQRSDAIDPTIAARPAISESSPRQLGSGRNDNSPQRADCPTLRRGPGPEARACELDINFTRSNSWPLPYGRLTPPLSKSTVRAHRTLQAHPRSASQKWPQSPGTPFCEKVQEGRLRRAPPCQHHELS